MKRVEEDGVWSLMCPHASPGANAIKLTTVIYNTGCNELVFVCPWQAFPALYDASLGALPRVEPLKGA